MLNGVDPIIIFQFKKLAPYLGSTIEKIPIISQIPDLIALPPIPVYFGRDSQSLIGLYIDSESKNVDIQTTTETQTDGTPPNVDQKGIANVVSINLFGKRNSVQLALLTTLVDQIFDRVTSKEYAISYLNGPITIFGGVLHSYSVEQNADNDLVNVKIELSKGQKEPTPKPTVGAVTPIPNAVTP